MNTAIQRSSTVLTQTRLRQVRLPDKGVWTNRFEIKSESSDRLYIVSQHADGRHWGCSCPGWITGRKCKHLTALGLPPHEKPYELPT